LLAAGFALKLDEPDQLRLLNRGSPQPFWIDDLDGSPVLRFFARASQSAYTAENVYTLAVSDALADSPIGDLIEPDTSSQTNVNEDIQVLLGAPPHGAYYHTARNEQNQQYLPQAGGNQHWYAQIIPAGGSPDLTLEISQPYPGAVKAALRLGVWGATEASADPDHHLRVQINGQLALDQSWDGQSYQVIQAVFDVDLLREGSNHLTVFAPGDSGSAVEVNYLDYLEVIYPRRLAAEQDRLDFISPGGKVQLLGYTAAPLVYEIASREDVRRIDDLDLQGSGSNQGISFETQAGARYLALAPGAAYRPERLVPLASTPDLRMLDGGADYLAVGPPDLLAPLQPLLDLRASQGWKPLSVPLQAVYDQFNYGLPEPEAIQRFVQHASQQWQPAPRTLLLVGDATYDPLGYLAPPVANRLPAFFVDTVYGGQTASDVGFVQVNDDPWPDLAVGRIPARRPQQVADYVEKVLGYEAQLEADSASTAPAILAIADGQDASFAQHAQSFLDAFGPGYPTDLYAPPPGDAGAPARVSQLLSDGRRLAAYFGHGSVNMWGKDRLFTVDDAAQMHNADHLPVVLNLTCLTGLFTHPEVESLAEALLFQPGGGAAAVLAPSSLTLAADQDFLARPFVQAFLADPRAALGELHLAARRQVDTDLPGQRDVMLTFMLFGDPALRLQGR